LPERIPEVARGVSIFSGESPRMGDPIVGAHQATELRLKNRRNVNRPLRPMDTRASETGSGTAVAPRAMFSPDTFETDVW